MILWTAGKCGLSLLKSVYCERAVTVLITPKQKRQHDKWKGNSCSVVYTQKYSNTCWYQHNDHMVNMAMNEAPIILSSVNIRWLCKGNDHWSIRCWCCNQCNNTVGYYYTDTTNIATSITVAAMTMANHVSSNTNDSISSSLVFLLSYSVKLNCFSSANMYCCT